jgi:hypothetical protein
MERVMSAIVILLEETDFAGMNEEWIKWSPANPPARQGAKLPGWNPRHESVYRGHCRGVAKSGDSSLAFR